MLYLTYVYTGAQVNANRLYLRHWELALQKYYILCSEKGQTYPQVNISIRKSLEAAM